MITKPTSLSHPCERVYGSRTDNVYKPVIKELKNLCPSCGGQMFFYSEYMSIGQVLRRRCKSGKTTGCLF